MFLNFEMNRQGPDCESKVRLLMLNYILHGRFELGLKQLKLCHMAKSWEWFLIEKKNIENPKNVALYYEYHLV